MLPILNHRDYGAAKVASPFQSRTLLGVFLPSRLLKSTRFLCCCINALNAALLHLPALGATVTVRVCLCYWSMCLGRGLSSWVAGQQYGNSKATMLLASGRIFFLSMAYMEARLLQERKPLFKTA